MAVLKVFEGPPDVNLNSFLIPLHLKVLFPSPPLFHLFLTGSLVVSDVGENKIILVCGLISEWGTKCGKTLLYALLRSSLDSVAGVH